jgi:hypothetical protein
LSPYLPRTLRALLCCLPVVAGLAGCVTRSPDFEPIRIDGWTYAAAVKNADTGQWHCFVSGRYDSGITVRISRSSRGYVLAFEKPEWSLEDGAIYSVTLSIDDLWQARIEGVATEDSIVVPLDFDDEALSALRRGSVLTMAAEAETFRFELTREATTLDRLESCYRRHLPQDAAGYHNPFAAAQNPFKVRPRADPATRSPTAMQPAELEEILRAATTLEFRADHASQFTPSADLVYALDDYIFGYYWEQSVAGRTVDTVLALTLAGMQRDCTGRAVSGRYPGRENDLAKVRRGFVTCEEDDFFADILILAKGDFAMTFVTSSSLDDAELAEAVGAGISSFIP